MVEGVWWTGKRWQRLHRVQCRLAAMEIHPIVRLERPYAGFSKFDEKKAAEAAFPVDYR
jgi:hypothetical protein